ncbi:type II secretion system F family protein [Aeromicrobium sp.]|jgi:tight adherence protein C|uniref:type II secretion system F family protein n=1 Tax=Aeromicrobium sp. TaxID=1871063 RepID=UPI0025B84334|nr:type II secretion system F family protein [Aeromicrobium sp.]MCK5891698.1 type II secretion system F family protein [Aeromicrobium sp.]
MIVALLIGAAAGTGLLALAWAIVPPRRDLAAAIATIDSRRSTAATPVRDDRESFPDRLGRWLTVHLERNGFTAPKLRSNLALLDRPLEAHLVSMLAMAAFGLSLPVMVSMIVNIAGVSTGFSMPLLAGLALAVGFALLPNTSVATAAATRRDELRRALACYLDLVSMALAGGRGVPEALPAAAHLGRGWSFDVIADTLTMARYSGTTPWEALRDLGERVDVAELRDLGAALGLVAADGAKVRDSLRARAATARARQLAEAEGAAERASTSITNAQLFLGFSFLLFLGYPAIAAVMAI